MSTKKSVDLAVNLFLYYNLIRNDYTFRPIQELTGVANPEEIIDELTEPSLLPYVKLHKVITVLDAEHVLEYNSIFASDRELVYTIRRQMEVADLLLLNKIDLVTDKQLKSIEKVIRKHNERSLILDYIFESLQPRQSHPQDSITFSKACKCRL